MDHTAGKCPCGHYHPVSEHNNLNIVQQEWIDIWNWVASQRLFHAGGEMNWELWIQLGRPDITNTQ
jgi:hypothetical protein